jgi:hypothetical protein
MIIRGTGVFGSPWLRHGFPALSMGTQSEGKFRKRWQTKTDVIRSAHPVFGRPGNLFALRNPRSFSAPVFASALKCPALLMPGPFPTAALPPLRISQAMHQQHFYTIELCAKSQPPTRFTILIHQRFPPWASVYQVTSPSRQPHDCLVALLSRCRPHASLGRASITAHRTARLFMQTRLVIAHTQRPKIRMASPAPSRRLPSGPETARPKPNSQ